MKTKALLALLLSAAAASAAAEPRLPGGRDYLLFRKKIAAAFRERGPAPMSLVDEPLPRGYAGNKVIAFTFDACRGRHNEYNAKLIDYLRAEKIPATLFITGSWADKFPDRLRELAADPLFEIENHGWRHRACSYAGERKYGVRAASRIEDMVDEMELGARRLQELTGRRPVFYRPAGAYTDSVCVWVAQQLGMETITYSLLSGDAQPRVPAAVIRDNILKRARPGAVVIMHFNRPEWHELEALKEAVPLLRARGYSFARLEDFSMPGN